MQQLVRMTRSILIFATIVSLTLAVPETRFRKCCPEGMVLSFLPELICTIPEEYTSELIIVDAEIADPQNEWKTKDVDIVHLSTLNTTDSLQASSCIEIMQGRSTNESALVAVNYRYSENDTVEEHEHPNASPLQLLNIRKCCSDHEMSFGALRWCVEFDHGNSQHMFFSLLPKLPVHFVEVSKGFPPCHWSNLASYNITAEDIQFENESLWVTLSKNGTSYSMPASIDNSCLDLSADSTPGSQLDFWVCDDRCRMNVCLFKYCPQQNHLDFLECTEENVFPAPSAFQDVLSNQTDTVWSKPGIAISYAFHCPGLRDYDSLEPLNLRYLLHKHFKEYCTDVFNNGTAVYMICHLGHVPDDHNFNIEEIPHGLMSVVQIVMQTPKRTRYEQLISQRYAIISFLDLISCVFLLLTLQVYSYLPFLQNVHGKTLMCNAASLFVSYSCHVIIIWGTPPLSPCCLGTECRSQSCATLGYITLFSWLSAFSWLNVMCFDIWQTFGRVRENRSGRRSQDKRFLRYSMYAWSFALIITLFCVTIDQLDFVPLSVKPSFGLFRCWFGPNTLGEIIFFQLPIGIQFISNVVFFILTSIHCNKVKTEIRRMADDPPDVRWSVFHADKAKLIMNLKLFVVMGILWIGEIATYLLSTCDTCEWKETVFYWVDTMNRLHGVPIFILFVLKPRVYRALKERLRLRKGERGIELRDVHDSRPEEVNLVP